MRTIYVLLISLFLAAPTSAQDTGCEAETDEFTGKTITRCPSTEMTVESQPDEDIWFAVAALRKVETKESTTSYFIFTTQSNSWNFLRQEKAYVLLDGNRQVKKLLKIDSNAEGGGVTESYGFRIEHNFLKQLSESAGFRMKVGRAVFQIPSKDLSASSLITQ